jgi:hypothetical protein
MTATTDAPTTLDTPRGHWSIAAKHTHPKGQAVDVVLCFRTATPPCTRRLYGFRNTGDGWRQVHGGHGPNVAAAVRAVAREDATRPIVHVALIPLLVAAATMPDHPAVPVHGGPELDALGEAEYDRERADDLDGDQ